MFGAFRLLLGGSTHVQHPLAKCEIQPTFSKSFKHHYYSLYPQNRYLPCP